MKIHLIMASVLSLCALSMGQPGFAPGGPGNAPRGGGPHGYPGGRGPSGGPMPGPGYSRGMGGPGAPSPSYRSAPMERSGPAPQRESIPSTRFGSVPDQYSPRGTENIRRREPDYSGRNNPSAPGPADTSRIQQALRQGDYDTIQRESRDIRSSTDRLDRMKPEMDVQERIQLPLIHHMYRQGTDLMEEGHSTRNDAKIRMGLQHINQANEKLGAPRPPSERQPRR